MNTLAAELEQLGFSVRRDVFGRSVTTFAIGGPLAYVVEPQTAAEVSQLVGLLAKEGCSFRVLGAGSNLLVPDEGLSDWVIRLGRGLRAVEVHGPKVQVGAAASVMNLSRQCARQGLAGLEFAGGIPASLGGAVFMNAGAHGGEFSEVLESIEIVLSDGELTSLPTSELTFSYRRTVLPPSSIVVGATLRLVVSDEEAVERRRAEHLAYRKATQPLSLPCAGSVFKNPSESSLAAGALLDRAGAKGMRVGGASVSSLHANWIVNEEKQATAADVRELVSQCQGKVLREHAIMLQPELVMW